MLFPSIVELNYTETEIPTYLPLLQLIDINIIDLDDSHLHSAQIKLVSPQSQFDVIQIDPPKSRIFNITDVNFTCITVSVSILMFI